MIRVYHKLAAVSRRNLKIFSKYPCAFSFRVDKRAVLWYNTEKKQIRYPAEEENEKTDNLNFTFTYDDAVDGRLLVSAYG